MKIERIRLVNFLSYRDTTLQFGNVVALVGQNSAGKSNVLKALKLLHDIPTFGLQTAIARRGGFDQLRHRSEGRPYDPSIEIWWRFDDVSPLSHYELSLASVSGKRYEVKSESAEMYLRGSDHLFFKHRKNKLSLDVSIEDWPLELTPEREVPIPQGQSALPVAVGYGGWQLMELFVGIQPLEMSPSNVAMLQDVTSTRELESDGSNTASIFEMLDSQTRRHLVEELAAIVPGITKVEVSHFSDKITLKFGQESGGKSREFLAKQMSDGTLRMFGLLLGLYRPSKPTLVIIEEPETAIHLGALQTLVEILRAHSDDTQVLLTTHSADIIDHLDVDELRIVWSEGGSSSISGIASHTIETIRSGLVGPGRLLKADALDPAGS